MSVVCVRVVGTVIGKAAPDNLRFFKGDCSEIEGEESFRFGALVPSRDDPVDGTGGTRVEVVSSSCLVDISSEALELFWFRRNVGATQTKGSCALG